jgi:hypothetical protein
MGSKYPRTDSAEHVLQLPEGAGRQCRESVGTEPAERARPGREAELEERIAQLEAKFVRKDNIIAEISQEYVALKRSLGTTKQTLDSP